jgi:uncharacterized protein YbdZ (MbtH family)
MDVIWCSRDGQRLEFCKVCNWGPILRYECSWRFYACRTESIPARFMYCWRSSAVTRMDVRTLCDEVIFLYLTWDVYSLPCKNCDGYAVTSHHGYQGSIQGDFVRDLKWTMWPWSRFPRFECRRFPRHIIHPSLFQCSSEPPNSPSQVCNDTEMIFSVWGFICRLPLGWYQSKEMNMKTVPLQLIFV